MSPATPTLGSQPTNLKTEGYTAWSIARFLPSFRVSTQVSTKSSTDTPWRPPGRVLYTDHDVFSQSWLERRARYQMIQKLNVEVIKRAGGTENHSKPKRKPSLKQKLDTKLFLRQKFFWLLGIFEYLQHWIFLTSFWLPTQVVTLVSAQVATQVSTETSTDTSTDTPWRPAKNAITPNDAPDEEPLEPQAKEQLRNIVNAKGKHRICRSLSHIKHKTKLFVRQKLDWLLGIFVHLYRERFLTLFIVGASGLLFWSGYALLACLITEIWLWVSFAWFAWTIRKDEIPQKDEESTIKKSHVPATLPVPEDCAQLVIPSEVRVFVYNGYNHTGEPLNQLPNEECGKEPWSIFTLHRRRESQPSGPPVIHEWRETFRGELEHLVQGEDLSMSPEGEDYVVTEDNFDKDWTLVAERRKKAQVAAEEDEQRRELFS